jgi:hypothetical protein
MLDRPGIQQGRAFAGARSGNFLMRVSGFDRTRRIGRCISRGDLQMETYSLDEIRAILQSTTTTQKERLATIARRYADRAGHGPDDLINEAFLRVLEGRRKWPRSIEVVPFLSGVMQGIASEWRVHDHAGSQP